MSFSGRMGVPITFLGKAVREKGEFVNRFYITVFGAVYSIMDPSGRLSYFELLDHLENGTVDGKKVFKRLVIWQVYRKPKVKEDK